MSENWIGSLERALDVVEGQLALARVLNAEAVQVETETLQRIFDEVKRLRENEARLRHEAVCGDRLTPDIFSNWNE